MKIRNLSKMYYSCPFKNLWARVLDRAYRDAVGKLSDIVSTVGEERDEKRLKSCKIRTRRLKKTEQENALYWFADDKSDYVGSSNFLCALFKLNKKEILKAITREIEWVL